MLSRIDELIYPNRCEVIEFSDPQRFVYPIFKNGYTSLNEYARQNNCRIYLNEQIKNFKEIHVILRDPAERFISGVNTFIFNLLKTNPSLDTNTIFYFTEQFLFLNRHYAPQLSWLLNLSKYLHPDTNLTLLGMDSLSEFTSLHISPPGEKKILSTEQIVSLRDNPYNVPYLTLDNLLISLIGKQLTLVEILAYIKKENYALYQKTLCTVLD